ncbi:MAG: hypothetical protein COC15_03595 [Legionellales bacterium]|nr:MAG: hypothetical protein COC15_03595 [Legionellales bacterium]
MAERIYTEIVTALQTQDTTTSKNVLARYRAILTDRLAGTNLYIVILCKAIQNANKQLVEFLLATTKMPEFKFQQHFGYTPVGLAHKLQHSDLLPILLKHSNKNFTMYVANKFGRMKVVAFLQQCGISFHHKLFGFLQRK